MPEGTESAGPVIRVGGEMVVDGPAHGPLDGVRPGDLAEEPRLEDQRPSDETRVAEGELQRHDAGRARPEDHDPVQPERVEHRCGVVGVLHGATAGPVVTTAPQRTAAVVRHHGEACEALGDRTPDLGVLATGVDQEHGRSGAADLDVEMRAIDTAAMDARRVRARQGVGVRAELGSGHRRQRIRGRGDVKPRVDAAQARWSSRGLTGREGRRGAYSPSPHQVGVPAGPGITRETA